MPIVGSGQARWYDSKMLRIAPAACTARSRSWAGLLGQAFAQALEAGGEALQIVGVTDGLELGVEERRLLLGERHRLLVGDALQLGVDGILTVDELRLRRRPARAPRVGLEALRLRRLEFGLEPLLLLLQPAEHALLASTRSSSAFLPARAASAVSTSSRAQTASATDWLASRRRPQRGQLGREGVRLGSQLLHRDGELRAAPARSRLAGPGSRSR